MTVDVKANDGMEPVLMLAPFFAPQTHAAMFRIHKLAKYLPEYGFRPIVVTTDINYLYNEDTSLLNELPNCVQIHRARHIEPTIRGLRMALGGRNRTFVAMKAAGAYASMSNPGCGKQATSRSLFPMSELVRIFGEWPDRYWTWSLSARSLCEQIVCTQDIRLLYTSAVPVSPLRLAGHLKLRHGLQWIADFRDPVGYGRKHSPAGIYASAMERRILSNVMCTAEHVVGLADSYGSIFFDLYGLSESRYSFIPTGLDEAYLDTPCTLSDTTPAFRHIGEVMPNQSRHVFSVLQHAYTLQPTIMSRFRLEFIGRQEINRPRVQALIASLPDWPYETRFIDHLPQRDVYALIQSAAACLLMPGRQRYWWTNFAKMVDYIALRVPVIADVPPISEARNELGQAGNGFFLGGEDIEHDAKTLLSWIEAGFPMRVDNDYCARYTARRQAEAFAHLFARQLSGTTTQ